METQWRVHTRVRLHFLTHCASKKKSIKYILFPFFAAQNEGLHEPPASFFARPLNSSYFSSLVLHLREYISFDRPRPEKGFSP